MNKWLAPLPIIRALNLRQYVVAADAVQKRETKRIGDRASAQRSRQY